jgi:hypothetical protein
MGTVGRYWGLTCGLKLVSGDKNRRVCVCACCSWD